MPRDGRGYPQQEKKGWKHEREREREGGGGLGNQNLVRVTGDILRTADATSGAQKQSDEKKCGSQDQGAL